jgi:hypothetical protein
MSIRKAMALAGLALVAVLVTVPVAMSAKGDDQVRAHTYVVRTVEDPSIDPIPASECPSGANFNANGYASSIATRASDAMVVKEKVRQVGVVRTCSQVTFPLVEGSTSPT